MPDEVLVERRGAIQIVTINRPAVKNALDATVAAAVAAAVDELDASDELRAGVLTGAGGTFSAGMDLKAFLRGETPSIEGRGLCGITMTPPRKPLIAAVEGWALAAGGQAGTIRARARAGRRKRRSNAASMIPRGCLASRACGNSCYGRAAGPGGNGVRAVVPARAKRLF